MSLDYRNAKAQMENSLDAIKNQKANMELAQTVLDNTRSNYQYGLATLTELLDAENALVQAKTTILIHYMTTKLPKYSFIRLRVNY